MKNFENGFSHVNKEVRNFFNFVPSFSYIKKVLKIKDNTAKVVYFPKKLVWGELKTSDFLTHAIIMLNKE